MFLSNVDYCRNCQPMITIVAFVYLKCCSWFGKTLFNRRNFNLFYNMQISCRVTHIKGKIAYLAVVKIKSSWINGILNLFANKLRYCLITGVPWVEEIFSTLILPSSLKKILPNANSLVCASGEQSVSFFRIDHRQNSARMTV